MGDTSSKEVPAKANIPSAVASKPVKPPRPDGRPGNDEPLPREKLPVALQKIVDDEETLFDQLYDGRQVHLPYKADLHK